MVALMTVVIVAFAAYAVDAGVLFQEKRELQVGAEAAALAIAQDCAGGNCGTFNGTAETYADANATDDEARVISVTFPQANQVRVDVGSRNGGEDRDGDPNTVDTFFAPVIGVNGVDVRASAVAEWGPVGSARTLPLIFGLCEWNQAVGSTTLPVDPSVFPTAIVPIVFHFGNGPDGPSECAFNAGQDIDPDETRLPGGFGWLEQTNCQTEILAGNWLKAKTGAGAPGSCDPAGLGLVVGNVVTIPIFDQIVKGGDIPECSSGGFCYHIFAFAGLEITGFRLPGGQEWRQGNYSVCDALGPGNSTTCLVGRFTDVFEPGAITGGPNLGALTISLVG